MTKTVWADGTNGTYDICGVCARAHGTIPRGGIGMWMGRCYICGKTTGLANAKHDYGLSDEAVQRIKDDENEYPMIDSETAADDYPQNREFMAVFDPQHLALMEDVIETSGKLGWDDRGLDEFTAAYRALTTYREERGLL